VIFAVLSDQVGSETGEVTCDVQSFTYEVRLFNLSSAPVSVVITPIHEDADVRADDLVVLSLDLPHELEYAGPPGAREPLRLGPGESIGVNADDAPISFVVKRSADAPGPSDDAKTVITRLRTEHRPAELRAILGDRQEPTVLLPCDPAS
jgi:rhodanese-related sulfurtransferase